MIIVKIGKNENINSDFDLSSKYNAFTDDDWRDDFQQYTSTIYKDLKEYFNKFK